MRNIQILGTLIFYYFGLSIMPSIGQSQVNLNQKSLEVVVDESSNAYFSIKFEKGSTLYSICKKYHVATIDAMMLNDISDPESISIGQELILPLNKSFFRVDNAFTEGYIPVYYKIKKSETLFRISKVYFSQDVKDMIERNGLSGFTLAIDQKLLVGYYRLEDNESTIKQEELVLIEREVNKSQSSKMNSTPENVALEQQTTHFEKAKPIYNSPNTQKDYLEAQETDNLYLQNNEANLAKAQREELVSTTKSTEGAPAIKNEAKFEKIVPTNDSVLNKGILSNDQGMATDSANFESPKETESSVISKSLKGIAYWDKKGKDYENLMVLHKTAKVNTLIKITNPVNGLSTFARVVGRIPENAFKKDIDVVMSPAVAKKIGAFDSRVQISMTYQINKP